jgi:uncharacterized membrane protein
MHAAGDAGQPLCVADDVDGAGVPAAGHDDQSLAAHVHDEGLVVEDQRVGFPRCAGPVLVCRGHAVFEVGGAVDLTGDQDGAVDEQGRLAALDHVEALAGQRTFAECRPVVGPTAGPGEAAAGPHQRVDNHRQGPGTAPPGESGQAADVVEVAVAEHYGVHAGQVEAELTLGAVLLGSAVPWIGLQPITLTGSVVLSVVALGVLSTGIAYVLNYRLIQDEGPTAASMTNYLTPVVAVLLGIAFVDERLTWNLIIGTAMILVGLWIAEHNSGEREVASEPLKLSEDETRGRERI